MFAKAPLDWMDWNKETQTFSEWLTAKAVEAEAAELAALSSVSPTPAPAATTPAPRPGPLAARKLTLAERDDEERQYYHFKLDVIRDDADGTTYRLNKEWAVPYVEVHQDLVTLLQTFYNIASYVLLTDTQRSTGRMLTTIELNTIRNNILEIDKSINYSIISLDSRKNVRTLQNSRYLLNRSIIDSYSSQQFLKPGVSVKERSSIDYSKKGKDADWSTVQKKLNWARAEVLKVRKLNDGMQDNSTATQVSYLAQDMRKALRRPTADRKQALDELANSFRIDTRSSLGRPVRWLGFPVNPPQGSTAYFRKENGAWVLWIGKNEEETCTKLSSLPPWTEGSY